MQKRWFTIINGQNLTDSQTVTQQLNGVGKIYSLRVHYEDTNGATSNTVGNLHSMVSKLQILDGSRVLHSLSMAEEMALNCYRRHKFPAHFLSQDAAAVIKEDAYIDFWLNGDDDAHYLDTENYTNPTLSFTHNFTISATAGFQTGKGALTVEALLGDSGVPPNQGFLMSKEFAVPTPASSGTPDLLLPTDLPYAALMVLAGVSGTAPSATITNFKLSIDNDTSIPYNRAVNSIINSLRDAHGPWTETMSPILSGTAATFDMDLFDGVGAWMDDAGATAKGIITVVSNNVLTEASTTGETVITRARAEGWLPFGAFYLPFGDGMDPNDFLNPTGLKKLDLLLTLGAANAYQVTTHQLAPR